MKIMVLAAAALVATSFSAAADHEGKADPPPGVATNEEVSLGEPGVAFVARYMGADTASQSAVSKVDNGEAEEALGVHLPVGVVPSGGGGGATPE